MKSAIERYVVWAVFIALTVFLAVYKTRMWIFGFGDNTFLVDLLNNIATTGKPMSQISASIADWFANVLSKHASVVCSLPLESPENRLFNYFKWHPYLVLYLLAPLSRVFTPMSVLCWATALSFSGMLLAVYCIVRREDGNILNALLTTIFVASLPVWSYGIQGQIYVDRFVLGLGIWFMYWLHYDRARQWLGWILGACLIMLSDRYGFMVGALVCGYFILHPQRFKHPRDLRWLALAAFGFLFTVLSIKFYVEYALTDGFLGGISLSGSLSKILSPDKLMRVFLCLNFIVIGVFACRSWKFYLLGIGLLLPNLVGSIGGAEKTGFATHYHSMYFPLLAMAVAVGAASWSKTFHKATFVTPMALAFGVFLNLGLWSSNDELTWKMSNIRSTPLVYLWRDLLSSYNGPLAARRENLIALNRAIPEGSRVTSPESFMPALLSGHEVHLYPVALKDSDYIVYQASRQADGTLGLFAAFSHLGEEDRNDQEKCLKEKARQFGFDLEHPTVIGDAAIVGRMK